MKQLLRPNLLKVILLLTFITFTNFLKANKGLEEKLINEYSFVSTTITTTGSLTCTVTCQAFPFPETCAGANDGGVELGADGGVFPYIFNIGFESNDFGSFGDLAPGTYDVTVTDANACTTVCSFMIDAASPINCEITDITNPTCSGSADGAITVSGIGGFAPYTYDVGGITTTSGVFTGLVSGTYTITITDANGCLTECSPITLVEPSSLSCSITTTDVTCSGDNDGTLSASAIGGTGPYQFSIDGVTFQTSSDFTGLSAGTYTLTLMDANGCTTTCEGSIFESDFLECGIFIINDILCNGDIDGAFEVGVYGGTPPYTYAIAGGTAQTNNIFTGLAAGTYDITIQDANACETQCSALITEPSSIVCSVVTTDQTCDGFLDGTVTAFATGGTAPYQYDIGFGANTTGFFTDLAPGLYTPTITDANGCSTVCTGLVNAASPLSVACGSTPILCNGDVEGTVYAEVQGGSAPYFYEWYDNNFNLVGTDFAVGDLGADVYNFIVTDANGCTAICTTIVDDVNDCCPNNYTIPGYELGFADYETNGTITCDQVILSGASVDLDAGIEIDLLPGFEVQLGAQMNAFIDGCDNGGGGVN